MIELRHSNCDKTQLNDTGGEKHSTIKPKNDLAQRKLVNFG